MTSIGFPLEHGDHVTPRSRRDTLGLALLACGLLSSCTYVAADLLAAAQYPGYSVAHQAISELSAIGAPTRRFWLLMSVPYGALLLAFGVGVLRVAGRREPLHVVGAMLVAFALSGFLWVYFPMHERGGAMAWQDVGHIVLSAATVLLLVLYIGFGAFALGMRFRIYSFATLLAIVAGSAVTFAWAPRLAAGTATPWLGLVERLFIYGYLLWIVVLSVALLRRPRTDATVGRPLRA